MKKNIITSILQLAVRMNAWIHQVIEKKAAHLDDCAWYPCPCQTKFPY